MSDDRADRHAAIIDAFRDGALPEEIAAQYDYSRRHTLRIIQRAQDSMTATERRAFRRKSQERRRELRRPDPERAARNVLIAADYLASLRITDLAAKYGVSKSRIFHILRDAGVRGAERAITRDPFYPARALKVAANLAGANVPQLISDWRSPKQLVHARWAVMANLHKRGVSTPMIGKCVGGRDHSTVLYGIRRAEEFAQRDIAFAEMLSRVDAA